MNNKTQNSKPILLLIHGFFRTNDDMNFLHLVLNNENYESHNINIPAFFSDIENSVKILKSEIEKINTKNKDIYVVAHSMGGLVFRQYAHQSDIPNLKKIIFIATPHKGTKLADILNKIKFFGKIIKPIKNLLTTINYEKLNNDIKVGVICGNKSNILSSFLIGKPNDGRVSVDSAKCEDMDDFVILLYNHFEIHHNVEALEYIKKFFENSSFG